MAAVGMGWRALGVAAMAAATLSVQGCGVVSCQNGVTVRAPEELADPSAGLLSVCALDQCVGERFEAGARSLRSWFTDLEGLEVWAVLVMPDDTQYSGSSTFTERRALGETCTVASINLEHDAEPGW